MNSRKNFDAIVLGMGSMGTAACYYLAKQGTHVLGLEQFDIPNEKGSHTGQSRLIRKAYFEHPNYVPLLQRAYQNWQHLEDITGEQIYYPTGLLYTALPDHWLLKGLQASADQYQIPLKNLEAIEVHAQYPSMHIPGNFNTVLETDAGFIIPEKAIRLYTKKAIEFGAVIKTNEAGLHWKQLADGIEVITATDKYFAKKLIITTGPWAGKMIPGLEGSLRVTRQVMAWVNTSENAMLELGKQPCWILATDEYPGIFYGFPVLPADRFEGPAGFKLAHHYPGEPTDPDMVNRIPTVEDEAKLIEIMHRFFPGAYKSINNIKTCLYTNTPDEHFIIDFLPVHDQKVMVAAGFSGHGFKFASVAGEILSDLAIEEKTSLPIDFLSADRFIPRSSKKQG